MEEARGNNSKKESLTVEQKEIIKKIESHSEAVIVKNEGMRDPYMVYNRYDDYYYLSGTTSGGNLDIWRSRDMAVWESVKTNHNVKDNPNYTDGNWLWAPEMHWDTKTNRWITVYCPGKNSAFMTTTGDSFDSGWNFPEAHSQFWSKHDPALFQDSDGEWYILHCMLNPAKKDNKTKVQQITNFNSSQDTKGTTLGEVFKIQPSDERLGHEGWQMLKIGSHYVFIGTAWSQGGTMKTGTYNLYYCTSKNLKGDKDGKYGERKYLGKCLGHGVLFQDRDGRWWCTAFPNYGAGETKESNGDKAYTINEKGTTIIPIDVTYDDDSVTITPKDARYATPGDEEIGYEDYKEYLKYIDGLSSEQTKPTIKEYRYRRLDHPIK
ncbi:MAG: family 43 glycosylhydrolase [Rikenellaceae bacterium]